ncbi:MAG: MBL fold metallo-hydrolase [Spartobacteria bacterium]
MRVEPLPSSAPELIVRFWGVRGSIPCPGPETVGYGGNTSCVELRLGNEVIILDAGSGIRPLGLSLTRELAEQSLDLTLLISHTHWDHIQGLPFFRPAYAPSNRIRIMGAAGTRARLQAALVSQMDPLQFPIALDSLAGIAAIDEFDSGTTTLGSFEVRTISLNHPGGCTGFRLTAEGVNIAYLPDHEPYQAALESSDPNVAAAAESAQSALLEFLEDCDLLILDSQYDRTEYPSHIGWGHGCLDESVALALRARVGSLFLFHHDPEHADEKIDAMLAQARRQVAESGSQMRVEAACERTQLAPRARQKTLAA